MKNTTWLIIVCVLVFFGSFTFLMEQRSVSTGTYLRRWHQEDGLVHEATPELRKRLGRLCDPKSLVQWAAAVLCQPASSRPSSQFFEGVELSPEEIPKCALEIFQNDALIAAAIEQTDGGERWVTIAWGHGRKQYGLILSPHRIQLPNDRNVFFVRWADGIYLWHDRAESRRR